MIGIGISTRGLAGRAGAQALALFCVALLFGAGCEWLKSGNLAKSSDETDDFKCTLETKAEDGLLQRSRSIPYTFECKAKGAKKVRFVNLKVSIVNTRYVNGRSQSRSLGEAVPGRRDVTIGGGQGYSYTGTVKTQTLSGALKGRRSLHISGTILYPGEPELDYEADRIEKASNAWRYNLLVTKKL